MTPTAIPQLASPTAARTVTVALVGNPNTGKTTLFNALAGMRQRVGNYPGVTVETKKGRVKHADATLELIDLPGTYSLAPRSPDEMLAVDVILGSQAGEPRPDVVLAIVDASNLERNLYLTTQLLELEVPVVIALNMVDLAQVRGLRIDADRLSKQLGLPVVPIQANKRRGLDALKDALLTAARSGTPPHKPTFPTAFEAEIAGLQSWTISQANHDGPVPEYLLRRALLDVGGHSEAHLVGRFGSDCRRELEAARARLTSAGCPSPGVEARSRYAWIRDVTAGCIERPTQRPVTWTDRIDRVLTHRLWGTLVFFALMFGVFMAIFSGAKPLMGLITDGVDGLGSLISGNLPPGPFTSLLVDGIVGGVGAVLVFLPQILILFAVIAILEDCGYMARAAFLMDKLMARCGLSGKSFIPMLSSMACAIPGIMATRVIEDRRDRLATILVAPLMSCSARLPVYILLIGAFLTTGYPWWLPGVVMFAMYSIGIVIAPLVALVLKRTLLRGAPPVFVMEMPAYKVPAAGTVLRRMGDSGWAFVRRAGTIILASMILVWALLYFPRDMGDGRAFDTHIAELENRVEKLEEQAESAEGDAKKELEEQIELEKGAIDELNGRWKRQSFLGQMGRAIEPAVKPLGWDWKLGMATLASFPAREVVVGTLGIIYGKGEVDTEEIKEAKEPGETTLGIALKEAEWDDRPGHKVFSVPVALSVMVFFALCCQCASTLAVIRRETKSWGWPIFTLLYMTGLAYLAALATYQVGTWLA